MTNVDGYRVQKRGLCSLLVCTQIQGLFGGPKPAQQQDGAELLRMRDPVIVSRKNSGTRRV